MLPLPAILGIAGGAIAVLSFGGGFLVSDWRSDGKIERLEGEKQILQSAVRRCEGDIESVRAGFAELKRMSQAQEQAAEKAMREAENDAAAHVAQAKKIRAAAPVPAGQECAAIIREQKAYVASRK